MPSVSVIIPVYNGERYLAEAINSALVQTVQPREVIVVDDGSNDATNNIAAEFQEAINLVRQENQGVAAARNRGAGIAKGDFLAFLDADDVWMPEKLEAQLALFAQEQQLGLVHCGVREVNAEGEVLREKCNGMSGWVSREFLMFRRPVVLGGGSGAMIPRRKFDEVGGFDPSLSTSADWDLYYRL